MASREETLAEYRIFSIRSPPFADHKRDLEWTCRSLGFLESRDKGKTAHRIFGALVESAKESKGYSSDKLAEMIGLSRGTIVHHLNKMIKSGLVIHHEGLYKLRGRSLKTTIEEITRDVDRIFEDLLKVAESIDENLGLYSR